MRHSFSHLAFLLVPGQTHPCGISLRLVASSLGVSWWHSRSGSWLGGERGQPQAHLAELWGGGGGAVRASSIHSVRNQDSFKPCPVVRKATSDRTSHLSAAS